jgi:hypothetical protein
MTQEDPLRSFREAKEASIQEYFRLLTELSEKLQATDDPKEKDRLCREWWLVAIDSFNEHVAGPIVTAHGVVLETPEIEL